MYRAVQQCWCKFTGSVSLSVMLFRHILSLTHSSVTAGILFVLMEIIQDPFRSHLFGIAPENSLLPLTLPYKTWTQRPMFSEMSFKCRSSTSLSSNTLVPFFGDSTTTLLPSRPDKSVGLGIYPPKSSSRSFLPPRPSLSSIRSQTAISALPPSSPLPPLPVYLPHRYRTGSAIHTAVYPPTRPQRPARTKSERTVRIVPPSPALSIANLQVHNKSVESPSSVCNRSIRGEECNSKPAQRPRELTVSSGSCRSRSTVTVKKSPLGAMRLADHPEVLVAAEVEVKLPSESSSEIDDATTL